MHHVVGQLVFENPLRNLRAEKPGYLWKRSYILCVWRPWWRPEGEAPPAQLAWRYTHLEAPSPASQRFHLRQCCNCARVRLLQGRTRARDTALGRPDGGPSPRGRLPVLRQLRQQTRLVRGARVCPSLHVP